MRNLFIIIIMVLPGFGCKDIREKLMPSFTVNIPAIKLSIPAIPFTQNKEIPVGALKAHINMDSTIRANTGGAFGSDAVSSVKVKKIDFILLNANADNNLSNFESGRMRIYSDNDTSATDIVSILFPKANADSLSISPKNPRDISNYLRGKQLHYNIFWKNRKPTTRRLNLLIKVWLSIQ